MENTFPTVLLWDFFYIVKLKNCSTGGGGDEPGLIKFRFNLQIDPSLSKQVRIQSSNRSGFVQIQYS